MNLLKINNILLTLCFLFVCAAAHGQGITLDLKKIEVKEAMETLKNEYSYSFVFEAGDVDTHKIISISANNATIEEVVGQIITEQPLAYEIKGRNIILSKAAAPVADEKNMITVRGAVLDETGNPLAGATVQDKKSRRTAITGIDGRFVIEATPRGTLQAAHIGYITQEVPVGSRTEIKITLLEEAQIFQDIVVIGYGTQKKENLTGAVATLDTKSIENRSVSNIAQALQGTVANLNIAPNANNSSSNWESSGGAPGAAQTVNLRGYTGFDDAGNTYSEPPLVVIDGIQGGDLNTINMNDVESIVVLKDAASSAIYGSSAPFGVILITTKSGARGQKATITYSNNFGFAQPISLPVMMNSLDYAMAFNQFSANANTASLYSAGTIKRILEYRNGIRTDETVKDTNTNAWLQTFSGNADNDWFDIHFKDVSFSQQHNLAVSGGTDKASYYVGLGYTDQEGMYTYGNDYYKHYNARTTLQTDITPWLKFGFRGAFSRGVKDSPNSSAFANANILHIVAQRRPSQPLYNPDGNFASGSYVMQFSNGGRINTISDEGTLVGELIVNPLKGWDITANYSFTGTYNQRATQLKTVYQTLPDGTLSPLTDTTPNSFSRRMDMNERHLINAYTSYEKTLGGHYFKAMAGFVQELNNFLYLSGSAKELYSDNVASITASYGQKDANDNKDPLALRGGFGRINYNYRERYLVEFNGRYDGTSRFLKDVRYKFYPGVSAAWVPSKETFWEPLLPVVNFFKIRASYGGQGSQGLLDYFPFFPALRTYSPSSTSGNWLFNGTQEPMVMYPNSLVNPNLTWVTTNTIDFGADISLFANRLNVSFDWYRRYARDYQGPSEALPALLGAAPPRSNNAAMQTTGFELTVNWAHRIGKVNYGVDAVLSDYRSVITKYPNPTGMTISGLGTVYNYYWYEGRQFGEIWGFETVGLFQSQEEINNAADQSLLNAKPWTVGDVRYADLDGDGQITWGDNTLANPGDRKIIGNSTPRYSYGVTLYADWKGLDFRVFVQGVGKRDSPANHNTGEYRFANFVWGVPRQGSYAQASMWEVHQDRYSAYNTPEENAKAFFPKYYFDDENMKNTYEQTRYLQNAAYARIKNIQIGYTLPASMMKKASIRQLRVFVNIENIATFTKMISTLDPEFSTSDGKLYPLQRVWAIGMNLTF